MKTWIIVAALGAAWAPAAAQQGTAPAAPRRAPAERPAPRPAAAPTPARAPIAAFRAHDAADLMPLVAEATALAHGARPMALEAAALAHAAMEDAAPALAAAHAALADMPSEIAGLSRARMALHGAMRPADRDFIDDDRHVATRSFARESEGVADVARAAWLQNDQADSTYREAREALNREQYQKASDLFRQIHTKQPRSGYAADALYWDAFALYRAGGDARLRESLALLDQQAKKFPRAETRSSAATLATRIRGQLAQDGDPRAGASIRSTAEGRAGASGSATCENDDVRIAAINALSQMDAARALPIVRRVLLKRDDCSAPLREKAVYVVSQHHPADADQILLDVVKNDPSAKVKRQAVYYLGQTKSERAIAALEELVRTSEDRDVQERALYSLAENGGARAAELLRAVAERESATESLRSKAIYYLRERRGGDHSAYLRGLYAKLTSTKLREQVLHSLSEIGGEENVRWLTAIAMDTTESVKVRSAALYRVSESRGASATSDLVAIFDRLRGREMRERALYYIGQRKEPAATAKLVEVLRSDAERSVREKALYYLAQREDAAAVDRVIEVAKTDADREMRRKAVYYLGQSKDPKAIRALEEIIAQ